MGERPLLLVQLKPGEQAGAGGFIASLTSRIAKWWMPDTVHFLEVISLGTTGKINKKRIPVDLKGLRFLAAE